MPKIKPVIERNNIFPHGGAKMSTVTRKIRSTCSVVQFTLAKFSFAWSMPMLPVTPYCTQCLGGARALPCEEHQLQRVDIEYGPYSCWSS